MEKPVNLNRFKKEKARAAKKARADENAVKFGRTKAQKTAEAQVSSLHTRRLDGAKRDDK